MKAQHFFTSTIAVLCGALLVGCGGTGSTPDANSTAGTGAGAFKVALVTPGDINDQGWNQLAYEGLQQLEKGGAKISHQVTKNPSEQQPALRDYADQKYDLILCHGFEYGERAKVVARNYPDTKFVIVGGNVTQEPNVATMIPKLEEATYLLGMVAGGMTKTNKVGLIGGMDLPVIKSTFESFEKGAKAVNPKVQVLINYVGNFEDQNAGKEVAKGMIARGADILFHNADQAGKGMFVAAQESKGKVLVFGSNRDQNNVAPDVTLASAVIELPRAFQQLVADIKTKKFKAEFRELNLSNGDISIHWNDKLKSKIPAPLLKKVEDAEAAIKSGKLKIKRNV
jgi:basic membrane lipoprotein Med (substrate-binding protein (PBP1-ABC) superfamily)